MFYIKNRYIFLKRLYNNYVILFVGKYGKYKSMGIDKELYKYIDDLDLRRVNYVICDSKNDLTMAVFEDNHYYLYYYRLKLRQLTTRFYDKFIEINKEKGDILLNEINQVK